MEKTKINNGQLKKYFLIALALALTALCAHSIVWSLTSYKSYIDSAGLSASETGSVMIYLFGHSLSMLWKYYGIAVCAAMAGLMLLWLKDFEQKRDAGSFETLTPDEQRQTKFKAVAALFFLLLFAVAALTSSARAIAALINYSAIDPDGLYAASLLRGVLLAGAAYYGVRLLERKGIDINKKCEDKKLAARAVVIVALSVAIGTALMMYYLLSGYESTNTDSVKIYYALAALTGLIESYSSAVFYCVLPHSLWNRFFSNEKTDRSKTRVEPTMLLSAIMTFMLCISVTLAPFSISYFGSALLSAVVTLVAAGIYNRRCGLLSCIAVYAAVGALPWLVMIVALSV